MAEFVINWLKFSNEWWRWLIECKFRKWKKNKFKKLELNYMKKTQCVCVLFQTIDLDIFDESNFSHYSKATKKKCKLDLTQKMEKNNKIETNNNDNMC